MGRYLKLLEEYTPKQVEKVCAVITPEVRGNSNEGCEHTIYRAYRATARPRIENLYQKQRLPNTSSKSTNINDLANISQSWEENPSKAGGEGGAFCAKSAESAVITFAEAFQAFRECDQNRALNHRYVQAVADGVRFLRDWGGKAEALGLTAEDLFGRENPPRPDLQQLLAQYGGYPAIPPDAWAKYDADVDTWKAWVRAGGKYDLTGLVWMLEGATVVALTATSVVIRTPSDSTRTLYWRGVDQSWARAVPR